MKILFVHPSVELYGADKILLYILTLIHKDNDITVLLPKNGELVTYIEKISKKIEIKICEDLPIVHSKLSLKDFFKLPVSVFNFNKKFKKNSYDLVYCNTLATTLFLYNKWSKNRIIHVHEIIENKFINFGFSILIKLRAKKVICVSEHVKRHLLFSKKYSVVHNGIPDLKTETEIRVKKSGKIVFVLPGRFMPKKGQWFLIDSLKLIPHEYIDRCEFYLFGSPPPNRTEYREDLENLVKCSGFENIIHLYPFKKNIEEIYQLADVVLVPSIMADPFPTTVLESMMYGKPVITTNHGGASEIVEENFGKLVSPNDTQQLSEAIIYFIENSEKIDDYGNNARRKYELTLTLDRFGERFLKEIRGF